MRSSRFLTTGCVCVWWDGERQSLCFLRRTPPAAFFGAGRTPPAAFSGAGRILSGHDVFWRPLPAPPPPPRPRPVSYPHDGLASPALIPTTASPRRLLSPPRTCLAANPVDLPYIDSAATIIQPQSRSRCELLDTMHAGVGILNWTEIQCVDLTQSLREGVRSLHSVAEGTFATLSSICEMFLFLHVGMDALDIE